MNLCRVWPRASKFNPEVVSDLPYPYPLITPRNDDHEIVEQSLMSRLTLLPACA